MKRSRTIVSLLFVMAVCSTLAAAQTCIGLAGANPFSHTQDFDALGDTAGPGNPAGSNIEELNPISPRRYLGKFDGAVNDDGDPLNLPGWAMVEEGSNVSAVSGRFAATDGSLPGPNTFSFGTGADRAFGSVTDPTHDLNFVGGCFTNTGPFTIPGVLIGFTGEMWRRGAVGLQTDTLDFQFAVNAVNLYDAGTASYTDFNALDFSTPNVTGLAGARDGNDAAFRTVLTLTEVPVVLAPGDTLYIRWRDIDIAGADDGLAIDDVSLSFLPPSAAPVEISGRVISADGTGVFRARIELDAFNGTKRYVVTNQFGQFRFGGVAAGQTYAISVSAKGHSFKTPTQVITIEESLGNIDFTAFE